MPIIRCLSTFEVFFSHDAHCFRELFQNSWERNSVSRLEDMLREEEALTLHPLKHDWMMQSVHRHTLTLSLTTVQKVRASPPGEGGRPSPCIR